jgi:hypothetical protein
VSVALRNGGYLACAILYALSVLTLLSMGMTALTAYSAVALAALAFGYSYSLRRGSTGLFSFLSGSSIAAEILLLVGSEVGGFALPWGVLGLGLFAILVGNHTIRAKGRFSARTGRPGTEERMFRETAKRGYMRIAYFVGLVMFLSLVVLVVSLNASIGMLNVPIAGLSMLLILLSLALLATSRHREN